jgi:GT2 family glycosyltransferase
MSDRAMAGSAVAERSAPPVALPRLAVVVLTWNGCADTLACLAALVPQLAPDDLAIVVDNGSHDGTEAAVRARFPDVRYVQNGANLGFAGGNNRGLDVALAELAPWILLLNSDACLAPGALAALRARAQASPPHVGVWQALLLRAAEPERIDSAGHALSWLPGARELLAGAPADAAGREPREIFGACAAAALLRREALLAAGLLDEALFVLLEDVDLMFRIRAAGFTAWLAPEARVLHRRGVSGGRGDRAARRRRKFWLQRNAVTLALRYWPTPALLLAAPVLAWRALQALVCGVRAGAGRCWPLWSDALRTRRETRARQRNAGVDRWFGG